MKNKLLLAGLLFSLLFTIGCNDEYEPPYNDHSGFVWYTSEAGSDIELSDYVLAINDTIIFSDLSHNELTHEWIAPASSVYVLGTSAQDEVVNVKFLESGIQEVVLRNTFKDSVTNATQVGDIWEVEKVFTVDVFADIVPSYKIMKGDEEILVVDEDFIIPETSADWPTVTLEAGQELTYMDLSTVGRPDARTWDLLGGSPNTTNAEIATVGYFGLGLYEAGTVTVKRNIAEKPDGETTRLIPLKVNVVPSSQPFVQVGQIKENESQVISFNVSGQIDVLEGEEGNFTVHVVNTAAGFDQNISVTSASINSEDLTQIDLVLAAPIYNSDEITVAYTAGNIVSVDTRVLESFDAVNVKMHENENIINDQYGGFEVASTNWKKAFCEGYWVGNTNNQSAPYFARTDVMANSGSASLKYESASGVTTVNLQGTNFTKGGATPHGIPTLVAGTYKVSFMVYLEDGNTMQGFRTILQNDDNIDTLWDVSTTPRGQWVKVSSVITTTVDSTNKKFNIKIQDSDNIGVTGEQIIYFDDLSFSQVELR